MNFKWLAHAFTNGAKLSRPAVAGSGGRPFLQFEFDFIAGQFSQSKQLDQLPGGPVLFEQTQHLGRRRLQSVCNHAHRELRLAQFPLQRSFDWLIGAQS
jgi:hypothetical protein